MFENENNMNLNNNNINNNNNLRLFENFDEIDIKNISKDIVPSFLLIIGINCILFFSKNYIDDIYNRILRVFLFIYFAYFFEGFYKFYLIYTNKIAIRFYNFFLLILKGLIDLSYYLCLIITYYILKNKHENPKQNYYKLFLFYSIIFMGISNIFQVLFDLVTIIILFPFFLCYYFMDPVSFQHQYAINPEIIKNINTIKADKNHCDTCIICLQDINLNDEIIILKCPGHHYFHGDCIKEWLHQKIKCPICANENII